MKGYYDVFNNFREQGLVLTIYNDDYSTCIWSCQERDSDNILVIISEEEMKNNNGLPDDRAYKNVKSFRPENIDKAVDYAYKIIRKIYKNDFVVGFNYHFQINRSLNDIDRIQTDASQLQYEDYYELATLNDKKSNISCDLIVLDGKFGLRYSKLDEDTNEYENLTFEEHEFDLSSDVTLFLDMKSYLEDFVEKELDHDIEFGTNNITI